VELEDRRRAPFDVLLIATGGCNRRFALANTRAFPSHGAATIF
jgi:hypothetical protein